MKKNETSKKPAVKLYAIHTPILDSIHSAHSFFYVAARSMDEASKSVLDYMNDNDIGFTADRRVVKVEVLASSHYGLGLPKRRLLTALEDKDKEENKQ